MNRFLWWLLDHVKLSALAPWVFGLAIWRMPHGVLTPFRDVAIYTLGIALALVCLAMQEGWLP